MYYAVNSFFKIVGVILLSNSWLNVFGGKKRKSWGEVVDLFLHIFMSNAR